VSARGASWRELSQRAPELAEAGRRLLVGADGIAIAFLATAARGGPHLSPVCPVFSGTGLFVVAAAATPKARDLRTRGRFALHAFLGASDEEFQVAGRAREVEDAAERAQVHRDVRFAAFDRADPIFELAIERALWVHWERPGQPGTRAIRQRWRAGAEGALSRRRRRA
jgi:hypothetical protein